ncbi:hypothetical protein [Actinomadura parmotrematis]|uniref:Uncharacterized protein n=1 Tax=Actinomadura parmotrematis TaxID=2864039 RepID=A0ABS7FU00_9ACTN|nr:hypothetical protein [Actinomadura parmotrematis]MBW8483887.1 hypothetical protein [Actinomadura parmotrematis]
MPAAVPAATSPYIDRLAERMSAGGCEVTRATLDGLPVTLGHRSGLMLAVKMHILVAAVRLPHVYEHDVARFTWAAMEAAKRRKGSLLAPTGVAVLAVLVVDGAEEGAKALARRTPSVDIAGDAHPVVVSQDDRQVHTPHRRRLVGEATNAYTRRTKRRYLPDPRDFPGPL